MTEYISPATKHVALPSPFAMKRGGKLYGAKIAYETWGSPSPSGDNVVLLLTGMSPNAHACSSKDDASPGWWEAMLGPGKPIDTNRWYVICLNSLGSCHGSTGAASYNAQTGELYRLNFPDLSIEDIADAAACVIRTLGFERLACVVGCSMGAMSALALIARNPGFAHGHINISGAVHALPFSIAIRAMQRKAILLDPNWNNGCYDDTNYPVDGMKTARKLGIITYRSANEWTDRFGRLHIRDQDRAKSGPFGIEFEVERYLEKQALRFARSYDPNCYLYMSQSIDWFDLGDCMTGNVELEFQNMSLDSALVIGVHSDILFPLHQQQRIADSLRERGVPTSFHALESSQGHDAFLVDIDRFGPVVRKYMEELTGGLSMHRRHVKPAERIGQLDAQAPQTSMGDRRSLRSKVPLPSNTTV